MTFRMKPLGFQFGSKGCVSPLLFVHRTIRLCSPCGVWDACQRRKLYLPSSFPSSVCCHVEPPSGEISTDFTPASPPKAIPRRVIGAPAATWSPDFTFVKNERGTIRLIGTNL